MTSSARRILVTNDDGVDSVALHELARAMRPHGEVVVVAPDTEYSGFGAAIGDVWLKSPGAHDGHIDGIDETFAVSGPPALCVMYASLGAFGRKPDLIVSGVNPGANLGRSVYHSGTVGAALAGRVHGIPGVAISQELKLSAEGQAWPDIVAGVDWTPATAVASKAVAGLIAGGLVGANSEPINTADLRVLNINMPAEAMTDIAGWHWGEVATRPRTTMASASLTPKPGFKGQHKIEVTFASSPDQAEGTDTWAVAQGYVSLSWISPLSALPPADTPATKTVDESLGDLLPR